MATIDKNGVIITADGRVACEDHACHKGHVYVNEGRAVWRVHDGRYTTNVHVSGNAVYDFSIDLDGRAHIGRVIYDDRGYGIRSTVMAGNFPTTNLNTGITLDPVPLSAMIQGF